MNGVAFMDPNSGHAGLNERKWDIRAATYDQKRFDYFRWMQRRVIGLIDLRPGCHFLDVGCGTGWAVRHVAGLLKGEGEFSGVDISGAMIETAQVLSGGLQNVFFYKANAEQIPLGDNCVDFAICTNSFHHYINPLKVLVEIQRVLTVKGRLYILDVTADDPLIRSINDRVKQREPEHVRFYSSQEYRTLFAAARLNYLNSRQVAYPLKVHFSEKFSQSESAGN